VTRDSLEWLFSLADQERGVGWNPRASADSQWNLGRTRALLDLAGAPDRQLRLALVAGTKGKGSTCAMLASILGVAGVRCGLYTKPHLQAYRERIRVDGRAISAADLAVHLETFRQFSQALPPAAGEPTTFEVTTAVALEVFASQGCRIAVVEVGLGGRLDATNATDPELSVITSISYDHTAILGRTLGAIAGEKAGILRPDRQALLAVQRPAAMRSLRRACDAVGAICRVVPPLEHDVALAGAHQRQNAALAVAAAKALIPDVRTTDIDAGLARIQWPGRFEIVGDVVLDGAHNDASAVALAETLRAYARDRGRPVDLVVGINRDKDARAVLRPLVGVAEQVWATQTSGNPRVLPAADLGRLCQQLGARTRVEPDLARALEQARQSPERIVCVTGSLLLVGQARRALGLPVPEALW
jgi:dihydrofolate synthase/folylpolyglutamate synthase